MALHERFDASGNRLLLTDREVAERDGRGGLAVIGVCAALLTPGFLVVRLLFPLLDGWVWFGVGVVLSGVIVVVLCWQLGRAAGAGVYVLLAIGSACYLFQTEPVTYYTHQADQAGHADSQAGKRYEHGRFFKTPRYQKVYSEAYRRGVLARVDKRVAWTEYPDGKTVEHHGEIVDFTFSFSELSDGRGCSFTGTYIVRTPEGEVRHINSSFCPEKCMSQAN